MAGGGGGGGPMSAATVYWAVHRAGRALCRLLHCRQAIVTPMLVSCCRSVDNRQAKAGVEPACLVQADGGHELAQHLPATHRLPCAIPHGLQLGLGRGSSTVRAIAGPACSQASSGRVDTHSACTHADVRLLASAFIDACLRKATEPQI